MSDAVHLLAQAERCFRLAMGTAGPELAEELEALGRAFRREARELEAGGLPSTSAEYRGRIVKSTGDGFLAEFASVVNTVRGAAEIRHGMVEPSPIAGAL